MGTWHDRVENNIDTASKLWFKAADNDNIAAIYNIAWCYDNGLSLPYNSTNAALLYHIAGDKVYTKAYNNLGVLYYYGKGGVKELSRSH